MNSRILLFVIVLLVPGLSDATPVTVNLSGNWFFFDDPTTVPEFAAAMGAIGVSSGSGLSFAFTFDDSAASNGSGVYASGLVSGALSLGTQLYTISGGTVHVAADFLHFFLPLVGPSVSASGHTYSPNFVQFDTRSAIPNGDLFAAIANANAWAPAASISFNAPGTPFGVGSGFRGASPLQVTSVSVPEPASLVIGTSLLLLVALRKKACSR